MYTLWGKDTRYILQGSCYRKDYRNSMAHTDSKLKLEVATKFLTHVGYQLSSLKRAIFQFTLSLLKTQQIIRLVSLGGF